MDRVWECKIGPAEPLPVGSDGVLREAVAEAYRVLTSTEPGFVFSGCGSSLTEAERAVVEDREPEPLTGDVAALRAEITTGWWEVDEAGRDQALARLDRIAAELEKARAEALGMTMRGDNVDAWLKRRRDWYERGESAYIALDDALNDYRDHADTGTPLHRDVPGPHAD